MMGLAAYQSAYSRAQGGRNLAVKQVQQQNEKLDGLRIKLDRVLKSQAFIQEVAQKTQQQLAVHIEGIVQLALSTVFPGAYRFELQFVPRRGQTEAELTFISEESGQVIDPMTAAGGGVVDMAAFGLRIATWSLGKSAPVLIFDEPFTRLSKDLHSRAGKILRELSDRLGLQIIMVTHNGEMARESAHRVFSVSLTDRVSKIQVHDMEGKPE